MIQDSVLFDARKLFDSIAADVYTDYKIHQKGDQPIRIRRKIDMHWTRAECSRKAVETLRAILDTLPADVRGRAPKSLSAPELIRAILLSRIAQQPRIREIMEGNRLMFSGEPMDYFRKAT